MMTTKKYSILIALLLPLSVTKMTSACSRLTYTAPDNVVVTGRSMDWFEDLQTELWLFPAGIERVGGKASNSVTWTSKYGSIVASAYNLGGTDGINTQGLNANLLYLATSNYGKPLANRKNLSIYAWVQYALDNYATVDEAVNKFSKEQFNILASALPNGLVPAVHLSITDPSGDNAVFEYINGELVIHHGKQYNVMTNEPTYDKQLALNDYWQRLNGVFLPGTSEPTDRFVRASYYLNTAPQATTDEKAVAIAMSIIRDVSAPISASISGKPNVATTIWRSAADLKHNIYYFENTDRPNIFWIDMNKLNLNVGAPVKKLPLIHHEIYAGEVNNKFVASAPYTSP